MDAPNASVRPGHGEDPADPDGVGRGSRPDRVVGRLVPGRAKRSSRLGRHPAAPASSRFAHASAVCSSRSQFRPYARKTVGTLGGGLDSEAVTTPVRIVLAGEERPDEPSRCVKAGGPEGRSPSPPVSRRAPRRTRRTSSASAASSSSTLSSVSGSWGTINHTTASFAENHSSNITSAIDRPRPLLFHPSGEFFPKIASQNRRGHRRGFVRSAAGARKISRRSEQHLPGRGFVVHIERPVDGASADQ